MKRKISFFNFWNEELLLRFPKQHQTCTVEDFHILDIYIYMYIYTWMPPPRSSVCIDVSWVNACISAVIAEPAVAGVLDWKTCTCKSDLILTRFNWVQVNSHDTRLVWIELKQFSFLHSFLFIIIISIVLF